ncbi:MAG: RHS domain-containing protein [Gammaproteobacteria bacterium]|nr:RHS domain-containing protein [Gammaproteobacteria bacterium]
MNQRITKTVNGITTTYVYGLNGELLAELDPAGVTQVEYYYLNGVPVAVSQQGNVYYLHTDQLGTPRTMTDATQKVVWRWDSDPFGVGLANEDPDGDGVKVTMNLRFAGQYFDQESGLHYNYNRYYDPQSGRYITSDPIGLGGGLNTYGYVGGNPIGWIDSSGQFAQVLVPVVVYGTAAVLISVYLYQEVQRAGERGIPGVVPPGSTISPFPNDNVLPIAQSNTPSDSDEAKSCGAEDTPNLTGVSEDEAEKILKENGFTKKPKQTAGGYQEWTNPDGSSIWIRPNGEIVRVGPKYPGKKYGPRYGPDGNVIPHSPGSDTHGTSEIINK